MEPRRKGGSELSKIVDVFFSLTLLLKRGRWEEKTCRDEKGRTEAELRGVRPQ